jgi:hypothetical protein
MKMRSSESVSVMNFWGSVLFKCQQDIESYRTLGQEIGVASQGTKMWPDKPALAFILRLLKSQNWVLA